MHRDRTMKHILIVDDNKMNLNTAKYVLNDKYKITAFSSSAQAVKFTSECCVDLILLDIMMPEMNGFEVWEQMREQELNRNTPVIFLTADNNPDTESRCFKVGARDFISKPFVPEVMRSRVDRIIESESVHQHLTSELKEKIKEMSELKTLAQKDALTSLWNRNYTETRLNEWFSHGVEGALFMIDMDNFKHINDTYGHIVGDHVLKSFAQILLAASDEEDIACRIGGDEFILFCKEATDRNILSLKAEDILSSLQRMIDECAFEANTSVSIGIACAPQDGSDFQTLYNAADKSLYYVKQNGKNSYHFFSEGNPASLSSDSKQVDLDYLRDILSRSDNGKGAYLLNFDNFNHVYNFIRRTVARGHKDVEIVLYTLQEAEDIQPLLSDFDEAVTILEEAIHSSLRRVDVSTRYSSKQIIVILMETNLENGRQVAERILAQYREMYVNPRIQIDYDIVQMKVEK